VILLNDGDGPCLEIDLYEVDRPEDGHSTGIDPVADPAEEDDTRFPPDP
jgi:hypothetical protein